MQQYASKKQHSFGSINASGRGGRPDNPLGLQPAPPPQKSLQRDKGPFFLRLEEQGADGAGEGNLWPLLCPQRCSFVCFGKAFKLNGVPAFAVIQVIRFTGGNGSCSLGFNPEERILMLPQN